MKIKSSPSFLNPIELIGPLDGQREAARKYCLIALSKGVRFVTVSTCHGSVSGRPTAVLAALSGESGKGFV